MSTLQDSGFWSRFWSGLTGRARLGKGDESKPFGNYSTPSGGSMSVESSLKLSAVWACVRLRAQTVGSLPLHLRKSDKEMAKNHRLYGLLHDAPNADMNASDFWEANYSVMDLWGNAYNLITRNGKKEVISIDPLDSQAMTVARSDSGRITYIYSESDGAERVYDEEDILHFKGFTLDGRIGLSVIQYAAEYLGGQVDANKAAQTEFRNGLKAGGFLKTGERVLTKPQREELRKHLSFFSKPENAGKYMVLEAGMDVAGSGSARVKPSDAQLLESRAFGIEEICRAFMVPPQLIGHTDKASSWASSLEQTNIAFLIYSLRPYLIKIEQEISRKLLTKVERTEYEPKFSVEGLLRADSKSRGEFYRNMSSIYTINEVRAFEDLPPMAGGDKLLVQLNMTTLEKIEEAKNE